MKYFERILLVPILLMDGVPTVKKLFSNDAGPTSSVRSRPIKRHQNMENSYLKRYMLVSRN
jgi:hypothetical protein